MATRKQKVPQWRDVLTDEEREILAKADEARRVWVELNRDRPRIVNRAINRARSQQMTEQRRASK